MTILVLFFSAAVAQIDATEARLLESVAKVDVGNWSELFAMPGHDAEEGDSLIYRLVKFSGKFHVLVVHFPIAFLLGACACQWWHVKNGKGAQPAMVMLWFGALGAVVAATLGWAYAYGTAYFGDSKDLLFFHRWLGTGTAVIAILTLVLKGKLGKVGLAIMLTVTAILVGLAGHFGGSLVYGSDHFTNF